MNKFFMLYGYSSGTDGTYFSGPRLFTQNKDFRTEEHFKYYRENGFNTLLLGGNDPYYGETWEMSQTKLNMDNAYKAGIDKIIVYDKRIFDYSECKDGIIGEDKDFKDEKQLEDFVSFCIKDYKKHPAFYGLMLVDEPRWFQLKALSQVIKAINKVDPEIFIHNNILPYYPGHGTLFVENFDGKDEAEAYRQYVADYLDATGMPYLMYDSYPMRLEPKVGYFIREEHLLGLQIAADEVKSRGRDFYFVCQTMAFYAHDKIVYRAPNEEEMYWQINCVLAFGIKSIGYFTYWRKQRNSDLEYFVDGTSCMTQDGQKTPLYYSLQKIHNELAEISDYLLDCVYEESDYFANLDVLPEHIAKMRKGNLDRLFDIKLEGKAAISATRLTHTPTKENVVCLFNALDPRGDTTSPCKVKITMKNAVVKRVFSLKKQTSEAFDEGAVTLAPGEAIFIVTK